MIKSRLVGLAIPFFGASQVSAEPTRLFWGDTLPVGNTVNLETGHYSNSIGDEEFASILQEIGLPQTELATALLFFNIGVEIGQVIFVLTVTTVFYLLGNWAATSLARLQQALLYGAGSLAAFWTLQRIAGF